MIDTVFSVAESHAISQDVYRLVLLPQRYVTPLPGTFINISLPARRDLILRRPFALCGWDDKQKSVELCYKVVGQGTQSLTELAPGDTLTGVYPLGNGFDIKDAKNIALIGGGVGVFPLLSVLRTHYKDAGRRFFSFLGYRDSASAVFADEYQRLSYKSYTCTDDCSLGEAGFVTDMFDRYYHSAAPDLALACGPVSMLKALQSMLKERYPDLKCLVSLEERMCCGFGACIVCTCAIKEDGQIKNKRVCADGPVFDIQEVVF